MREAQLRAREETLQGVRVAEELARRDLASQKAAYESRIRALEAELVSAPRPRPAWGRRPPPRLPRRTRHAACAVSPRRADALAAGGGRAAPRGPWEPVPSPPCSSPPPRPRRAPLCPRPA